MAELFRDEFTAANGTTLASRGYSVDATDSSATVQSNQARLQSTANGSWMEVTRDEGEPDAGILLDAYAESGSGNKWFAVMFRGGYALGFDIGSRTATLYRGDTWATLATVSNFLPANPESTPFTLRVEFEGTAIRARAWETGGSEGSGWTLSITNSLFDDSSYGFFLEGFSSSTRSWFVDNVSYYDFNAPIESPFEPTFPGANGDPLPVDDWNVSIGGSATAQQTGDGGMRLTTPDNANASVYAVSKRVNWANQRIRYDIEITSSGSQAYRGYFLHGFRAPVPIEENNPELFTDGEATGYEFGRWDGGSYSATGYGGTFYAAASVLIEFEGTDLRWKIWPTGDPEPVSWETGTLAGFTSPGTVYWGVFRDSSGPHVAVIRNISVTDLDASSGPTYSEPGSDTAALSEAGTDALTRGEPGVDVVVLSESGSDTLHTGNHWNEPGDDAVVLGESGADAHVMSERGGDLVALASSGVDAINLAREAGNDIVVLGESGTDSMVSRILEAGGDTVVFAEGGTDGLGFTESGVDTVVLAEGGVESSGYVETGGDTVVVGAGGVDWLVVVEAGGDTVGLSVSGTDRLVWAEYGADAVVAGESGIDVYAGVAWLADTVVLAGSGTDVASTDVEPLPRLSLVIPRVNELQWRALVDWAGRLVDALLIRLAPEPPPPPPLGYRMGEVLYFTSNDTFTKGDYPGLQAVIVEVQGGGGAGGGATTTGTFESSFGNGGGAGGYARRTILAGDLAASVSVTVGAGGTGVAGAAGGSGGASSFGSHCSANGGSGGDTVGAATTITVGSPGNNGGLATGDFAIAGGAGGAGFRIQNTVGNTVGAGGEGGTSYMGAGGARRGGAASGQNGRAYGGGGGGAVNYTGQATARSGGNGGQGIVIVTIYY